SSANIFPSDHRATVPRTGARTGRFSDAQSFQGDNSVFYGNVLQTTFLNMNKEKLSALARDLRKTPPRSPRETLGGFAIAERMLDKARADLLGINGEYNFYPCGLGAFFWKFTGL